MFRISYDEVVKKIKEEKGLSEQEIDDRVNNKVKQLSHLISKDGAVHIIANELGIKLYANIFKKRYKINELMTGLRSVEIILKVLQKYDVREYKNDKRSGRVATLFVGDESGACRLVIWDENVIARYFGEIKEGDVIKILNAYVRENNGYKELHLGGNSAFVLNPENETIGEVSSLRQQQRMSYRRKTLERLDANEFAEVAGTVVQIFEPRFYVGCPECYKKLNESKQCPEHGLVNERAIPIVSMVLDDGTDSVRVSVFRENVEKLLNKSYDEILQMKEDHLLFDDIRSEILGKQFAVTGKANRNEMFDSMEFNANSVREINAADVINEIMPGSLPIADGKA